MLLNSVEDLRVRLNVEDRPKINTALKDILADITLAFENHLGTNFGREQHVDNFYIDPSNYLTNTPILYLLLKGFSPANYSVSLKGSALSHTETINPKYYTVDPNTAIVSVHQYWRKGDYILVSYTSGFDLADDGETYIGVPSVLQRASLMFAENLFLSKYGDSKDSVGIDYTRPPRGVTQLLDRFDRHAPHCLRPYA